MIFTRKELNQRAIDYVNQKLNNGWRISYKYSTCKKQFFLLVPIKRIKPNDDLGEWIIFGLNRNGDYEFTIESKVNGKTQSFNKYIWYNAYDKFFAETKEEAEDLWLSHNT